MIPRKDDSNDHSCTVGFVRFSQVFLWPKKKIGNYSEKFAPYNNSHIIEHDPMTDASSKKGGSNSPGGQQQAALLSYLRDSDSTFLNGEQRFLSTQTPARIEGTCFPRLYLKAKSFD